MRRHCRVGVAHPFRDAPVHRPVQQGLGYGGAASLGLGDINELAAPGVEAMHQRQHYGGHGMFAGGVIGIGDFGHYRAAVAVAGDVGQAGGALGGRPRGAEVGPRPLKPVAGGRHHNDVRSDLAQVAVFQPEVADDAGGEVFGEYVRNGDQFPQHGAAFRAAQIQGQAQFVAVLLVEIGAPVPEIARHFVLIQGIGAVALQPLHRFQADDLRAHIGQPFHCRGDGNELPHFDDADALQRPGHSHIR